MMYLTLPDGEPVNHLKRLLPDIINPAALSDEELLAYDIVRCTVNYQTVHWWQRRGERTVDLNVSPAAVVYPAEDLDLATVKARAWDQIKGVRHEKRTAGVTHLFPDTTEGTVQIRDEDMSNLLALHAAATSALMNQTDTLMPFTDGENVTRYLAPADVIALCLNAFEHGASVHVTSQNLRDQVEAAQTVADAVAVEWPVN